MKYIHSPLFFTFLLFLFVFQILNGVIHLCETCGVHSTFLLSCAHETQCHFYEEEKDCAGLSFSCETEQNSHHICKTCNSSFLVVKKEVLAFVLFFPIPLFFQKLCISSFSSLPALTPPFQILYLRHCSFLC
jgi:hypothetical protein